MQHFTTSDYSRGLTARQNARGRIAYAVIPLIVLIIIFSNPAELSKWYKTFSFGAIFLISLLTMLSLFFWYQVLDRRVKLVIKQEGIWIRKYGFLAWDDVDSYHIEIRTEKVIECILWIETKNLGRSLKQDVAILDKEIEEIISAIRQCSRGHGVRFSGIYESEY